MVFGVTMPYLEIDFRAKTLSSRPKGRFPKNLLAGGSRGGPNDERPGRRNEGGARKTTSRGLSSTVY